MSKSLNLFAPAAGGTALILGLAYGMSSRDYGEQTIENLELRVEQSEASAAQAIERAREADAQIAQLVTERDEFAQMAASGGGLTQPAPSTGVVFNLGRTALPEEIAAWDVDVLPDGRGLPEGSGDVWTGEEVFVAQCASCHGDFAEGVGNWPVLAGGFDTLANEDPVKTVGSYWPYLSTVWDYVHRSMPFGAAGTLSADETYAIVAYILYSNNLVDDDFVLSHENFTEVEMYNTDGFVIDDRAELEYAQWRVEPCMENCKDSVEITMHASVLDVTPEEEGGEGEDHAMAAETPDEEPIQTAEATPGDEAPADEGVAAVVTLDPALVEAGQGLFRQCSACHQVGDNARNGSGPHLNNVVGRTIGSVEGFRYSGAFNEANAAGDVWTEESLTAFLMDPRGAMSGTKMAFRGLRNAEDAPALIAYLQSLATP